jgi:hypothetical protein
VTFFIFLSILINNSSASNISISARFEPDQIDISEEARYIVEINNATPSSFSHPKIDGLYKRSEQTYQSSSMINGKVSQKTSFIFSFIPAKEGVIEIPEYEIIISGKSCFVPSSKLLVSRSVAPNSNTSKNSGRQKNQAVQVFVTAEETKAYVGGPIPATISISLHESVQLASNVKIELIGSDFLQSEISSQPELQTQGNREIYNLNTFITPVKSGQNSLAFNITFNLQVLREMGFFSFAEQMQRNFTSEPIFIEALPLPKAPKNFTGGIGKFSLNNLHLSSDRALVGEPITLSVDIVGQGNFSRLQKPTIIANEDWKCFPPKFNFRPQAEDEFHGTKTVEYVIIPQKTGQIPLPEISLIYFSPETGTYETATIDTSNKFVLVSRSTDSFPSGDAENSPSQSNISEQNYGANSDNSLHIFSSDTRHFKNLKPFYRDIHFWWLQIILSLIALASFLRTLKQSKTSPKKSEKWNAKSVKKRLLQALERGNATEFYKLTLEILNKRVGISDDNYEHRVEAIKRLKHQGHQNISWLENFFNEADAAIFGQKKMDKLHVLQQIDKLIKFIDDINAKK